MGKGYFYIATGLKASERPERATEVAVRVSKAEVVGKN